MYSALRNKSITLALVFSLAIQGVSSAFHLREFFRLLGLMWPLVWILPLILIWAASRFEVRLIRNEKLRHSVAIGMVLLSVYASYQISKYTSVFKADEPPTARQTERESFKKLGSKPGAR